eukprot:14335356-Alexandrium_andersonii.AAC.1
MKHTCARPACARTARVQHLHAPTSQALAIARSCPRHSGCEACDGWSDIEPCGSHHTLRQM